jgi:glycosyltransferase involved in cell wall biosynthesis
LKIAIINRHPADVMGGSEMQCDNIATGLHAKGHDVTYIAPAGVTGKNYGRNYTVQPVVSESGSIARAIAEGKPDIVYWRLNKYHFYRAVKETARRNIPVVFAMSHINDSKRFTFVENPFKGPVQFLRAMKQGLLNAWNHRGYKYISGVTTMNPDFLKLLPIDKQCFVPNSVDTVSVPFAWPRPYILWVSNLKAAKRPELFVKLAHVLASRDIDFLMVGSIQSEEYKWIAQENARTPNFHYLGPKTLQEVNGMLAGALMLVHTCKPEGFPNNFLQAWFQGRPTVAFEFDPAACIENNKLGGNAKGDWDALVSIVSNLLDDDALRTATGVRAKAYAESTYSVERTVDTLESFLMEIVSGYAASVSGQP